MIDRDTALVQPNHVADRAIPPVVTRQNPDTPPACDKDALYASEQRPATLAPRLDQIPPAMRSRRRWVSWTLMRDAKRGGRWGKVPLITSKVAKNQIRKARSNDASTWGSWGTVEMAAATRWLTPVFDVPPAPGYVLGDGHMGIDLDHARNPVTGELHPLAARIVAEHPGYWEVSPSGTGLKGFFVGSLPDDWDRGYRATADGMDIEVYSGGDRRGRFFCVTGHRLDTATPDLTDITPTLTTFLDEFFPPKPERPAPVARTVTRSNSATTPPADVSRRQRVARARGWLRARPGAISGQGGHDHTISTCGTVIRGFDLSFYEALPLLLEWNLTCDEQWDEVSETGSNSLRRKMRDADAEPGPRGWMLERDTGRNTPTVRGYDDITPDEVAALAAVTTTAAPEPCPHAAAAEVRASLDGGRCRCCVLTNVRRRSTGQYASLPFGCNGRECRECSLRRMRELIDETAPYLIRMTGDGKIVPYAGVVTHASRDALIRAVQRRGGSFLWVNTADPAACADALSACGPVSYLVPSEKNPCFQAEAPNTTLAVCGLGECVFVAILPADQSVPPDLARVSVAAALRAVGEALHSPPPRPAGATLWRAWGRSHSWGDRPEERPSDLEVKGRPKLSGADIREAAAELGITCQFASSDPRVQGRPIGWRGKTAAHDAVFDLLIRGVGASHWPTKDRVVSMATWWFEHLDTLDVGDGYNVVDVLKRHLWSGIPFGIEGELLDAAAQDREEARVALVAEPMVRSIQQQWRGRKAEASELIRMFLVA